MDRVGNARFGVRLPHNYLRWAEWSSAFSKIGYAVDSIQRQLKLYPAPLTVVFDRQLHFVVVLRRAAAAR
jgi:hypothetical protein